MKKRQYRQFLLERGSERLTTWLEDDRRLKEGARLTLKDDSGGAWRIVIRYTIFLSNPPDTKWEVGGLVR